VVVLDAGNALNSDTRKDVNAASEGRITIEAMNVMGYDAMALGPSDLELGVELLRARMAEARFAVLSGNVLVDGAPFAEPYAILETGGLKVAVLGLTAPLEAPIDGIEVLDPLAAAGEYVPALRRQADIVVVLANLGQDVEEQLLESVGGIDMVIGGGSGVPSGNVPRGETPRWARAGGLGEYVGVTILLLDENNGVAGYSHQSLLLGPAYSDDQKMVELKARYQEQYMTEPTAEPQ